MMFGWKSRLKIGGKRKRSALNKETKITSKNQEISENLSDNLNDIKEAFGNSGDLAIREFKMGKPSLHKVAIIYINGLADKELIGRSIIERLMRNISDSETVNPPSPSELFTYIKDNILTVGTVEDILDWNKLLSSLLSGQTILLINGSKQAISCFVQGGEKRAIAEPSGEPAVRGPKNSFTEALITNTAMVRQRIKSPNLWMETMKLGNITQTDIAIMYVNGIVNNDLLTEVKERLGKIEADEIDGANTVEEWITDNRWTIWPTVLVTERPDIVAGDLMEGRVAIFVDGTPEPLILPATWTQFFQSAEDYHINWIIASFWRLLRIVALLIAIIGPALFVAFLSYHPELIPTPLLINLAAQRQGIPFPIFIEALLMEFTFEVLREAGVRLPRPVGQAVSIVGALVIGQAAVEAGIVSSAMVIVVAGTAIASFTIPLNQMMNAARLIRFIMMIFAASFGLYGLGIAVILLVAHTCSIRSFGIPYLAPFAPLILADWKDTIIRLPRPLLSKRPRLISQMKTKRTDQTQEHGPSPRGK
ncbi:spore germination protein [Bacillus sp. B15-48]|uniref:spore germination protein n=1 Tax=Bacillus sp. B15-48 TaxID=1548601 RepID=UPI00193F9B10|nr:spore germination protein [Bacillus sp. B15-48]MBM4765141.1 spore germination protein [Bacillus sp. B15-48]